MPTRYYRQCPGCRHVELQEDKQEFTAACTVCGHPILPKEIRPFIEPKSFVSSSAEPHGKDPGLTRLRPPLAQEARLISASPDSAFAINPTNVPWTSWAWQDAQQGRMFVVNQGRGYGFLRCLCGFAKPLKNPGPHIQQIRNDGHRTPYNQACNLNSWHIEDLAHEFRTDILQIRSEQPIPFLATLRPDEIDGWREGFVRTLVEALRSAAAQLLEIDQREVSGTNRFWRFGYGIGKDEASVLVQIFVARMRDELGDAMPIILAGLTGVPPAIDDKAAAGGAQPVNGEAKPEENPMMKLITQSFLAKSIRFKMPHPDVHIDGVPDEEEQARPPEPRERNITELQRPAVSDTKKIQ
jgi:hypothetical protein